VSLNWATAGGKEGVGLLANDAVLFVTVGFDVACDPRCAGGEKLWEEQGFKGKHKLNGEHDLMHSIALAGGGGELVLRQLWRHATSSSQRLARLGLKTTPDSQPSHVGQEKDGEFLFPGVAVEEIPARIMSLLCLTIEARLWSYAWGRYVYPQHFAAGLAEGQSGEDALQQMRYFWEVMTSVEAAGSQFPGLRALLQEVYWYALPA
jgi:hypothetical protein